MVQDHDNLVEASASYAAQQAETSLRLLLAALDIDQAAMGWQVRLVPFAPVWAEMIAAGSQTHATMAAASGGERIAK